MSERSDLHFSFTSRSRLLAQIRPRVAYLTSTLVLPLKPTLNAGNNALSKASLTVLSSHGPCQSLHINRTPPINQIRQTTRIPTTTTPRASKKEPRYVTLVSCSSSEARLHNSLHGTVETCHLTETRPEPRKAAVAGRLQTPRWTFNVSNNSWKKLSYREMVDINSLRALALVPGVAIDYAVKKAFKSDPEETFFNSHATEH
ncbi:hypothetical protein SLS58_006404 [Diplodia intermedia]|uniref:Uncharacterized protein n=1 Tax=Diplodia intermedia TaxID=856260 RepID=A0ABR3TMU9_9PEZI